MSQDALNSQSCFLILDMDMEIRDHCNREKASGEWGWFARST